jgi:hypothetical protein
MPFLPLERMRERVSRARENSDAEYFDSLMLAGEFATKLVVAGLVSAVDDDADRHRYRQIHRLVRATGLGVWGDVLEELLTGPTAQFRTAAEEEVRALTQKKPPVPWAAEAVGAIHRASAELVADTPDVPGNPSLRDWFRIFVHLRNKTRGHGAQGPVQRSAACEALATSIELVLSNLPLFGRPWAYLHRNLSGKYRVAYIGASSRTFDELRSKTSTSLPNGVYVEFDRPRLVEMLRSDGELSDFYCPNGGFNEKRFELISYITGAATAAPADPYLAPATSLPASETRARGTLEIVGNSFANLPVRPPGYIKREGLQQELSRCLTDDRHPLVTLHGRGGIGKTSLALEVLNDLALSGQYSAILWFSARDVDLMTTGPKPVKPDVLNEIDIATEYARLIDAPDFGAKGFKPVEFMRRELERAAAGPTLFVFDNFETASSPVDLFRWIDASVRLPNKVLITTRLNEFNGDYQIAVSGMEEEESEKLIEGTASSLGISHLLTSEYKRRLHEEAEGHPYVMKVLLGEVANAGRLLAVERIVASKENILTALFERTYASLDPAARRVFLTLCSWRSWVPRVGLEAVLLRPANADKMDVEKGIDALRKSSLIEVLTSDKHEFLRAPLVASLFGRRKLSTDPSSAAVAADVALLRAFGATQESDLRQGIKPHVEKVFALASEALARGPEQFENYVPVLEYVAQDYPQAWLMMSRLYAESGNANGWKRSVDALKRYIEVAPQDADRRPAWRELALYSQRTGELEAALHAWGEFARSPMNSVEEISEAANRINGLLRDFKDHDYDRRSLITPVVDAFSRFWKQADGTDLSRLAWLHLNLEEEPAARRVVEKALAVDPKNDHVLRLARKLEIPGF